MTDRGAKGRTLSAPTAIARRLAADRRGAVAFETMLVYLALMLVFILPLADFVTSGLQYMKAWQAMNAFAQYVQSNPPPKPEDTSTWAPANSTTVIGSSTISKVTVLCGGDFTGSTPNAPQTCTSANVGTLPVKYFSYTTSVALTPMILSSAFCANATTPPCTYTLSYSGSFN